MFDYLSVPDLYNHCRETQLSKRVADWTGRLEPILRAQEAAPEFNIHTYSDLVLTQVGSASKMDFERRFSRLGLITDQNTDEVEAVRLKERRMSVQMDASLVNFEEILDQDSTSSAEVCRVFLACLMLANTGNLDLFPPVKNSPTHKITSNKKKDNSKEMMNQKENSVDEKSGFSVRLLNNTRSRNIEEFRAPSVTI